MCDLGVVNCHFAEAVLEERSDQERKNNSDPEEESERCQTFLLLAIEKAVHQVEKEETRTSLYLCVPCLQLDSLSGFNCSRKEGKVDANLELP